MLPLRRHRHVEGDELSRAALPAGLDYSEHAAAIGSSTSRPRTAGELHFSGTETCHLPAVFRSSIGDSCCWMSDFDDSDQVLKALEVPRITGDQG
jgi:hypothetical protein